MQNRTVGDFVALVRGNTYKSSILSDSDGPLLLGLGSINRNGGFKRGSSKHYPGPSDPRILLHPGDLYVSLKDLTQACDLLGAVSRVPQDVYEGRLTQDTVKLEFGNSVTCLEKLYVYWSLRTPQYRAYCKARGTGTTNMSLSRSDFLTWIVPEESSTRTRLISLFENIDFKITLNNQLNDYLLEAAKAIFERWLNNAQGDLVSIAKVASLNPDTYSPKEKWPLVQYLDTGSITRGAISAFQTIEPASETLPSRARRKVQAGDIVYSTVRPNQEHYGILLNPDSDVLVSTGFTVVRSSNQLICPEALYLFLTQDSLTKSLQQIAEQSVSTYPSIKADDLGTLELPLPTEAEAIDLQAALGVLFQLMEANRNENVRLAELRDVLLPKLMSDDIDVSQIGVA